nr:polysaccharide lyase 6 family protein [Shewanella holmiensis]
MATSESNQGVAELASSTEPTPYSFQNPIFDSVTKAQLLESSRHTFVKLSAVPLATDVQLNALKSQLTKAIDGEQIIIPRGDYRNLGLVNISANKLTIKAQNPGQTVFSGLVQLEVTGDDVTLDSLVFTNGGPFERFGGIKLMGDNNRLVNSTFKDFNHGYPYQADENRQEYPRYLWLSIWGKNATVTHNLFEGKAKRGTLIGVQKDETPDNHVIEYNIFADMKPNQYNEFAIEHAIRYNANSWEAIRIGDSKASQYPSNTSFSHNLLVGMDGERELISVKSGNNLITGNTIFESSSMISLRHGKANHVTNNIILGNNKDLTGGIRIYDEDHVISNNYISQLSGKDGGVKGNADLRGAIVINTGIIDVEHDEVLSQQTKGKELNKQWTPKNITISHNSLINNQWGIIHGDQVHRVSLFDNAEVKDIFAGDNIHFSANIVYASRPDGVVLKTNAKYPLTRSSYNQEHYVGRLENAAKVSGFASQLPDSSNTQSAKSVGADLSKLKLITADVAGPDYVIKN